MIYFFHHYELPHIIYQERLQTVVGTLHHHTATNNVSYIEIFLFCINTCCFKGTATLSVRLRVSTTSRQEQPTMVNQTSAAENRIPAAAADSTSTPPSLNNEVNFENSSSSIEYANAEPIPDDSSADESTSVEQRVAEELVSVAFHDLFGGSGDSNITSRV
jgi:hypothetical protein